MTLRDLISERVKPANEWDYEINSAISPNITKLWHPVLNGELQPTDITPGSKRYVWWRCENGHAWKARPYSIKSGAGCPYCSGRMPIPGETDLATTHPHLIKMWSKHNQILPTQVSHGSHKKVRWSCDRNHEWEASIASVVSGVDCPYCAGRKAIPGETDLTSVRPDIAAQWDHDRNGTLDPTMILPSAHDKVWWKCDRGHTWQAVVFSRTRDNGSGCPYCTGKKVLSGYNDLATLRPQLATEWHWVLNEGLLPGDVTLGSNKKVWWQCGNGHVWQAAVYSRTRKKASGCPVCAGMVKQGIHTTEEVQRSRKKADAFASGILNINAR